MINGFYGNFKCKKCNKVTKHDYTESRTVIPKIFNKENIVYDVKIVFCRKCNKINVNETEVK